MFIVRNLNKLQFERINRKHIILIYFVIRILFTLSDAMTRMQNPTDIDIQYYAGALFPLSCIQSHVDIVGPLFIAFVCAILVSGELTSGMFKQPLLNGVTKAELTISKITSIIGIAVICFLFSIICSYVVGFVFWGNVMFSKFSYCMGRFCLLLLPHITLCVFLFLLALYMRNIPSMMCASLIIFLVNNLFSQFFSKILIKTDFMYYFYAFSEYNGMQITKSTIVSGILVNAVSLVILIVWIKNKMERLAV